MPKSTGENWFGTPGASRYLGVTLRTLYRLIDSGEIRAYRIARVIWVRRSDLDSYLERNVVQPGTLGHLYPPGSNGHAGAPDEVPLEGQAPDQP